MTAPTHTAHARFTLASALFRLAIRICPSSFFNRFCEETIDLTEFHGYEQRLDYGYWTADGTQRKSDW